MNTAARLAPVLLLIAEAGAQEPAPAPLPSDPVVEAVLADGSTLAGRLRSLSADGGAVLVVEGEGDRSIEPGALIMLSATGSPPAGNQPEAPLLLFPEGDQIRGQLDSADEDAVAIRSDPLGELRVPLDSVLGFTTRPPRGDRREADLVATIRETPRASDLLLLANGDRREVTFSALTADEVSYLDADRAMRLPREAVLALGLDPGLVRRPEIDGPSLDLILDDGSRIRLVDASASGGRLTGRTTFGAAVDVPLGRLAVAYLLGDVVAYLSDLEATREVTIPYIGPARPARPGGSVLGGPLVVGGRAAVRGLGTQSRSLLAYRLGPADRRFQARVAPDDAAGHLGNVVFRVLVDGEERFASPPMAVGDTPIPIDVDLQGGQFLILATEFGLGGGVRDFAAWLDARLIREPAAENPAPDAAGPGN